MLQLGERVEMKGRTLTVTRTAFDCLPRTRDFFITVAREGATVTYGELREQLHLPYAPVGMGRLLDLLSEDYDRRAEPSLAAVVVNRATGEVGHDHATDAAAERIRVYRQRHWS